MIRVARYDEVGAPIPPRLVIPQVGPRPVYQSTIPVPWKIRVSAHGFDEFGGTLWFHQCGRKIAYFDKDEAVCKAWILARPFRYRGMVFRAYLCPWCEWYHLGHTKEER